MTNGTPNVLIPVSELVPCGLDRGMAISPQGHVRASSVLRDELNYIIQTESGQQTLSAAEFQQKYGWENREAELVIGP